MEIKQNPFLIWFRFDELVNAQNTCDLNILYNSLKTDEIWGVGNETLKEFCKEKKVSHDTCNTP